MASKHGIRTMLGYLAELFPARDITDATGAAWLATFPEVSDEALLAAARASVREPGRAFFPTPGEIRAHLPGVTHAAIDVDGTLQAISNLGELHVESGRWRYPTTHRVADALGPAIAEAYGGAGSSLLFADSSITRDIALRDFVRALSQAVARGGPAAIALPPQRRDELARLGAQEPSS